MPQKSFHFHLMQPPPILVIHTHSSEGRAAPPPPPTMYPFRNSETTIKPFYPKPCSLLSRVFFCSINFCCFTVFTTLLPPSSSSFFSLSLFFFSWWTDPHCDRSTSNIQYHFWKGTGRERRTKDVPEPSNYSFKSRIKHTWATHCVPFPFSQQPHSTQTSEVLCSQGRNRKTTKIFCNWQKGKIKQKKRMCCKHLCPAGQRKFVFHFPNSEEQRQIRTYSTTTCGHPFPPSR